jgi:NAD(P)H-flavin reductase/nitrite reductase/ring-hydroxylating ferredoxin subunit
MDKNWFAIGDAGDFVEDEPAAAVVDGQAIAVFRLGDELFALKDLCTHGNAKLSDGYVEDGCVECPLHQGLFDIRSGAPRCAPVTEAAQTFPVRVVAGKVEVGMPFTVAGSAIAPAPVVQKVGAVIDAITRAAPDVAVLSLRCDNQTVLEYKPGQYVDVLLSDGQRRSYSMATAAGSHMLELHVRHLPGGLFTDRVFSTLAIGDALLVEGPGGDFYLRQSEAPVLLLASGTGFAPIKALVEHAIAIGNSRPMRLYWGGRKEADLYMDALCRNWAETLPWFKYIPVLSDAATESSWQGRTGFVHVAAMHDHPDLSRHEVYACGAPVAVEAARREFTAVCGLPEAQFFADAFLSKADARN